MPLVLNGTTGVSGVDGSAGTPALRGTDADSGVYFTGSQVGFSTNGAGTTMTMDSSGNVTFPGTVVMSSPFAMRNKIINGAMEIDQRNAGASITPSANAYSVDRWGCGPAGSGRQSFQQSSTAPNGFVKSLLATVTTTNASPGSTDYNQLYQAIEGLNMIDLAWGTSAAKTITLSFWVRSSLTGNMPFCIINNAANRSFVVNYVINSANTWEYKTITIPGDTAGTWLTDNQTFLYAIFTQGAGSSYVTPTPGAWVAGYYRTTSTSVNIMATNGATFYLTGVQLEVGSAATPFERRLYSQELAMCQRYYQKSYSQGTAVGASGTDGRVYYVLGTTSDTINKGVSVRLSPTMRATPTVTSYNDAGSSGVLDIPAAAPSFILNNDSMFQIFVDTSSREVAGHWAASAEL